MRLRHGISPDQATEALADPMRIVLIPDYNSRSEQGIRVIGFCVSSGQVLSIILLHHEGITYGVNGWKSNEKDSRIYREGDMP